MIYGTEWVFFRHGKYLALGDEIINTDILYIVKKCLATLNFAKEYAEILSRLELQIIYAQQVSGTLQNMSDEVYTIVGTSTILRFY